MNDGIFPSNLPYPDQFSPWKSKERVFDMAEYGLNPHLRHWREIGLCAEIEGNKAISNMINFFYD